MERAECVESVPGVHGGRNKVSIADATSGKPQSAHRSPYGQSELIHLQQIDYEQPCTLSRSTGVRWLSVPNHSTGAHNATLSLYASRSVQPFRPARYLRRW